MRLLYNSLQLLLVPLALLYVPYLLIAKKRRFKHLFSRLGRDLQEVSTINADRPSVWIHALSVGEFTSAYPLIKELSSTEPPLTIYVSCSTESGYKLAKEMTSGLVDKVVIFPIDLLWVVRRYIRVLNPSLFVLVETDFWPNLITELFLSSIPLVLVNGRISKRSFSRYQRFSFYFTPLFEKFTLLCMQTESDAQSMKDLGVTEAKMRVVGNLKCYRKRARLSRSRDSYGLADEQIFIVCGSTHLGEEELIFSVYTHLLQRSPMLKLAVAPRKIERINELQVKATNMGFSSCLLSEHPSHLEDILLIDTIGDLADIYGICDIAFIGGSLVPEGGHNPLEAVSHGVSVLFGPHMDDFEEIAQQLTEAEAAIQVEDITELQSTLLRLINRPELRTDTGRNAQKFLQDKQDVVAKHCALIRTFL